MTGLECDGCGYRTTAVDHRRCPDCGAELVDAMFGSDGAVWSWTVVHPAEGEPYGLAYVDLICGPRVLARFDRSLSVHCGDPVAITAEDGVPRLVPG